MYMKKVMTLAAMALCTLALCLTSCSKDDDNEGTGTHELTKEEFLKAQAEVLDSLPGDYEGVFNARVKGQGIINMNFKWQVRKDGIVFIDDFPYEALALGVSTDDNSSEAYRLRSALRDAGFAALQFRLTGDQDSKNPADIYGTPHITTTVKTAEGTYNVVGRLRNERVKGHYDIKSSNLHMTFTIHKLERVIEHQGYAEYKEVKKFTIPIEFEIRTTKKKKIK